MTLTPKEFMSTLDQQLRTEPARTDGVTAAFQFEISGPTGGNWWIEADQGKGAVHEGSNEQATLVVSMTDEVLIAMATGELDGTTAYYDGMMTVEGDQSKLGFLAPLFGE
jgi:putative sterol carrier protein